MEHDDLTGKTINYEYSPGFTLTGTVSYVLKRNDDGKPVEYIVHQASLTPRPVTVKVEWITEVLETV